jgi:hypothetical protein
LMRLYTTGSREGGFESGIGLALETLLWSPAFLIRMEHDRAGATSGTVQRLSDLELASRLSFFLWTFATRWPRRLSFSSPARFVTTEVSSSS